MSVARDPRPVRGASAFPTPALTTISFPADEMGDVAARILLGRVVGGDAASDQILVRPTLTVRDSTGKPRT